jgi:hypothetical protein
MARKFDLDDLIVPTIDGRSPALAGVLIADKWLVWPANQWQTGSHQNQEKGWLAICDGRVSGQ